MAVECHSVRILTSKHDVIPGPVIWSTFNGLFRLHNLAIDWLAIVIPTLMRRHFTAPKALGVAPLIGAARTDTTSPEGVPFGAAAGAGTKPKSVVIGAPGAGRAVDIGLGHSCYSGAD